MWGNSVRKEFNGVVKVFEISDSFIKYKELQLDLSCGHLPQEKLNEKKKKRSTFERPLPQPH